MLTIENFAQELQTLTKIKHFCLAFSGGLDSVVLLHLLLALKANTDDFHLRVVHVHHGLSKHADKWANECALICKNANVPFTIHYLIASRPKTNIEEWARKERYRALSTYLDENEALVTAHHQNDQAETLLLQLFRGAGPKGLAGMPGIMDLGKGKLIRPLLNYTRASLEHYANSNQLTWVEDDSNSDIRFDRNFLRHELMPLIKQRWPSITECLARTAKHCARVTDYLEKQVAQLFQEIYVFENQALDTRKLQQHDVFTQSCIIRYWLDFLHLPLPSTKKLEAIHNEILKSREDATPLISWAQVEIRRYDNLLYAMNPLKHHCSSLVINWDLKQDLTLPNDLGIISLKDLSDLGVRIDELSQVTIRFRQGGERCRLKNRKHTSSLKKLFQEWRIPPWNRDRIPLLYSQNKLKAIVGFTACDQHTS